MFWDGGIQIHRRQGDRGQSLTVADAQRVNARGGADPSLPPKRAPARAECSRRVSMRRKQDAFLSPKVPLQTRRAFTQDVNMQEKRPYFVPKHVHGSDLGKQAEIR